MGALTRDDNTITAIGGVDSVSGDVEDLVKDASTGGLHVHIVGGGGTGGTAETDDSAFTAGSDSGTPVMGFASSDTVDSGDVGVLAMDTSRNLKVSIEVDNVGIGGGTQYTLGDDTYTEATSIGTLAAAVRNDTLAALADTDNEIAPLQVNASGALYTTLPSTLLTTTQADDVANTTDGVNTTGFLYAFDGTTWDRVRAGFGDNAGATGLLNVVGMMFDGSTNDRMRGDSTNGLLVNLGSNNDVTIDNSSIVHAEDSQHTSTDDGIMPLAVRNDTLAALGGTDGDYAPFQVNASGALFIQEGAALDVSAATVTVDLGSNNDVIQSTHDNFNANANVQQGNSDVGSGNPLEVTLANGSVPSHAVTNAGTFAVQVDGDALTALQLIDNSIYVDDADWTADTSSHTLVGGVTQATPSANTDGDTTPLITNSLRELRVAIPESDLATASTTHVKKYFTGSTPTDGIVWSPAAGTRWYVTDIFINTTADATITLEDDLTGGDSVVWSATISANSGWSHSFNTPLFSGEDAADLIVTADAGTIKVMVTGYEI